MNMLDKEQVKLLKIKIYIVPKYKLIYFTNQKVGCSSIKLALMKLHLNDNEFDTNKIHKLNILQDPDDYGWKNFIHLLNSDSFIFTFVRHPISRLLSGYKEKILRPTQQSSFVPKILTYLNKNSYSFHADQISFGMFLKGLESVDPITIDPHWRHQYINIQSKNVKFNFIGRFENFDDDFKKLIKLANLPNVSIPYKNSSLLCKDIGKIDDNLLIDSNIRNRIFNLYREDFDEFDYFVDSVW